MLFLFFSLACFKSGPSKLDALAARYFSGSTGISVNLKIERADEHAQSFALAG